jgi:hypothetical protein
MVTKILTWNLDKDTKYLAERFPLPILSSKPHKQYGGLDYPLREGTWRRYIICDNFPSYCYYPHRPEYLLGSPSNIIRCFQDGKSLEALALTVAWGGMVRTKNSIYTRPIKDMERFLKKCVDLIEEKNSIESAWSHLVGKLN